MEELPVPIKSQLYCDSKAQTNARIRIFINSAPYWTQCGTATLDNMVNYAAIVIKFDQEKERR